MGTILRRIAQVCAVFAVVGVIATAVPVRAAVSEVLPFSARLSTLAGFSVPDGSYSVTFRIYSTATGGSALWTEVQTVTATDGEFIAYLGEVTSLVGAGIEFQTSPYYLSFQVGTDPEMSPRYMVGSVPSALTSRNSERIGGESLGNLFVKSGNNVVSGNTTFNGTLTVTSAADFGGLTIVGGAITAGSFQGATISPLYGGTGRTSATLNGVLIGNGTSPFKVSTAGTPGQFLVADGTGEPAFVSLSGDATLSSAGAITVSNGAITNAKLANSSLTINTGTGLSGGGLVQLGGSLSLTNTGVTAIAGTANQIVLSGSTGSVTASLAANISGITSVTATGTIQGDIVNGTSDVRINGVSINTAGTLANVAYKNQANTFTLQNTFSAGITSPGTGTNSETFGAGSTAGGTKSLAAGYGATAPANYSVVLGADTYMGAGNAESVVVGVGAGVDAAETTALGAYSYVGALGGTALGSYVYVNGVDTVAIGSSVYVAGSNAVSIGSNGVTGSDSISIGENARANAVGSIAIGRGAQTTNSNTLVIGSDTAPITTAFLGKGQTSATPQTITINATGGFGANIAGGGLVLAGGRSTGSANGGGVVLQYSPPGSSGSSLNALQTACLVSGNDGSLSCPGSGSNSERFGAGSTAGGVGATTIGRNASANGTNALAIGGSSAATAQGAISIGSSSNAAVRSIAIGASAATYADGAIAIGYEASSLNANTLVVGSDTGIISRAFFGNGEIASVPQGFTLNATGGFGTNITGAGLALAGGRGTGTGVGGNITFQYAPAGSSGSSLNALVTACTISGSNGSLSCPGIGSGS